MWSHSLRHRGARWARHLILARLRRRGQGRLPSRSPSSRRGLRPIHHQQRRGREIARGRAANGRRSVFELLCLRLVFLRQRPEIDRKVSYKNLTRLS